MGTYAWVAVILTVLLGLVLGLGADSDNGLAAVSLPSSGPWLGATLDDGQRIWELAAGGRLELPPGDYRLTLFDRIGGSVQRLLQLSGDEPDLGPGLDSGLDTNLGAGSVAPLNAVDAGAR